MVVSIEDQGSTASPKDQRDRTDGDDQPEDLVQRKLQNPTRIVVSVIYPLVICCSEVENHHCQ